MASPIIREISRKFIDRATACEHVAGPARDNAAIDFFLGAAVGLMAAKDNEAALEVMNFAKGNLATGGYSEVRLAAFEGAGPRSVIAGDVRA